MSLAAARGQTLASSAVRGLGSFISFQRIRLRGVEVLVGAGASVEQLDRDLGAHSSCRERNETMPRVAMMT